MVAFIKVESRYMVQHSAPMPILRSSNRYQSCHFEWTTWMQYLKLIKFAQKGKELNTCRIVSN